MAISIQVPSEDQNQSIDLQATIQQIINQKGAFRHITENSVLHDETRDKIDFESGQPNSIQDGSTNEEDDTPQTRLEKLWKSREDMLQHLGRAQNEVLTMLDSLSLLLSKHSLPAQNSMSPALKQLVPTGTIEGRIVQKNEPAKGYLQQLDGTSHGWRSQAFESSFKNLSSAADRLCIEAERESKYWAEVSALDQQGWQVSRHPRDSKAIGVHLGFAESAPQFRNKGFALLHQDEDSNVYIDQGSASRKAKVLSVSIARGGTETGSYTPTNVVFSDESDLTKSLTHTRNSLFEEELYYEVAREARAISGYGVGVRASTISFDVEGDLRVVLSFDDQSLSQHTSTTSGQDDTLAHFIGLSLRCNLLKAHEENLARRSRAPLPMSLKPVREPEYNILRPVTAFLRHTFLMKQLQHHVESILKPLEKAEVRIKNSYTNGQTLSLPAEALTAENSVLKPIESLLRITLPSERALEIRIASLLGPPTYGTTYTTSELKYEFTNVNSLKQNRLDDLLNTISRIILFDLAAVVMATTAQRSPNEPSWTVSRPQIGEMTLTVEGRVLGKVKLDVTQNSFGLKLQLLKDSSIDKKAAWVWTESEMDTFGDVGDLKADTRSFLGIVKQIAEI